MNHFRRSVLMLALSLSAASLVGVPVVLACSCAPPPPPEQAVRDSVGVFLGRVIAITDDREGFQRTVTFQVERWWKGGDSEQIQVVTATSGAACGVAFKMNDRYLVYAHARRGNELWQTTICSRTRNAAHPMIADELKAIGPGSAPKAK